MTLYEFTDVLHIFVLERLLKVSLHLFYFCNQTLREHKTARSDGSGFPEVLCCHIQYPSETLGDLNVSQDPATLFRGLSLHGMEVKAGTKSVYEEGYMTDSYGLYF